MESKRWILMGYRLPREPSTPRIALWRKLRQIGVVQLFDSLAALPLDSRNRERLEWLADEVIEAGGEASIWIAEPTSASQEREMISRLQSAVATEYQSLIERALSAGTLDESARRRALARLRRELHRIEERDYFPPPERAQAREAVEAIASTPEVRG
jgi:ChrB-like protein